ncbi:hypothetical protein CLV56_1147 [Mumia flava]|uniref:HTH tetR-type domain-containing protein n=1 Tax=Mumia flava TaxID=1348852 RepID=A0A0B2BM93_9ACTN|nr:hypothetical protein [Mumia flava]PJJ56929.1 hypothetical protein CLV56_1147 [Mumia flava]
MSEREAAERRDGARTPRTDGRRRRGDQTRRRITRHAVDLASLDGLDGLSIGRLASDLGLSKSGIQTLFTTKENLQLATIAAARDAFVDAVVRPGGAGRGLSELSELVDRWIAYAEGPLFAGGCFWSANLPAFDSRPGPVRDALLTQRRAWLALLASHVRAARPRVTDADAGLAAFQIDAILTATNVAIQLGERDAAAHARRAIAAVVGPSVPPSL